MDAERAKISLSTAIRAGIFLAAIVGGYYAMTASVRSEISGLRDRVISIETTMNNADLAKLPAQMATITENQKAGAEWREKTDDKLDRLLRKNGDD